ncbi:MAG: T9SS type A sorting domain-containing protein, partial [Melioribacteraceae bacterium]|nr:T9SS type A sorting domain-containing protein [Melioribacteraceae bacterium]
NDFDVSYSTSSIAYTGAEDGFPAGNLNAFPDKLNDWVTGVEEIHSDAVPTKYELTQNYPNPFNPTTKIQYSIPEAANVTLRIYDILGSEVVTLISNEAQRVGKYEVDFNASRLSSGIYFYTITAGNFVQTKKMILMK